MFENILKTSREIIEFGWTRDRTPVDSFITGIATSVRERYEEQVVICTVLSLCIFTVYWLSA